jgi:hypothetical protein
LDGRWYTHYDTVRYRYRYQTSRHARHKTLPNLAMKPRRAWKCKHILRSIVGIIFLWLLGWLHRRLLLWGDHTRHTQSQAWFPIPSSVAFYSQVHCVGDNFLPLAWTYKSCQYRNICREVAFNNTPDWTLYPSPIAVELHRAWSNSNNISRRYARYSTSFQDVSVLPMAVHSSHRRPPPQKHRTHQQQRRDSWAPTVQWESRTLATARTIQDRIVVPIFVKRLHSNIPNDFSFFSILAQVLLPVYNLLGLFGWQQEKELVDVFVLSHPSNDCDMDCLELLRVGIETLLGYRLLVLNATNDTTCYKRGAAGMGFLSANGLSKRGFDAKDYQEPRALHNAGRGGTFWEFVQHVWEQQGSSMTSSDPLEAEGDLQVQLAMSQNGSRADWGLIRSLSDSFASYPAIKVSTLVTKAISVRQLVQLARNSNVWIVNAKDGARTWPALFLPRGSTLCLLYEPQEKPKPDEHSSDHSIFYDFGIWNHVSHLQVHWLALPRNQKDLNRLSKLIQSLILEHVEGNEDSVFSSNNELRNSAVSQPPTDLTFQGHPLHMIRSPPLPFQAHCLGGNWEWDSAHYRSCRIRNLCFDTIKKEFMISSTLTTSKRSLSKQDFLATTLQPVMMGETIRFGTARDWSPNIFPANTSSSYYALPSDILWLPYYADVPNANNPGHLLWDFMFPLYTLMEMYFSVNPKLLLTNVDNDCIATRIKDACYKLTVKFLPLLGVKPDSFVHSLGAEFHGSTPIEESQSHEPTSYVCATNAAIGIGMLTDHGIKKHGQLISDYQSVRNSGRGMAFWRFRKFMLDNLRLYDQPKPRNSPVVITFSVHSSQNPSRSKDFAAQMHDIRQRFSPDRVTVQAVELRGLTLEEQLSIILESSIFISVVGGAASTTMFLQRNSCLILYFNDQDDFVRNMRKVTSMPAMLDWDFWNHASHLRVHWLPLSTMDTVGDRGIFMKVIEAELEASW